MQTNLTWGDIVIHALLILGGAFVVYLFSLLYRYIARRVTDYWARRSVATTRAKIARLEQRRAEYEADFADSRLFMARIIKNGLFPLFWGIALVGLLLMVLSYNIAARISCAGSQNCPDVTKYYERASLGVMVLLLIVELLGLTALSNFALEIRPTKFLDYFATRI
jgi:hypothetical protein